MAEKASKWSRRASGAGRVQGGGGRGSNWAAKRMAAAKLMPNPLAVGAASATHV